MDGLERDLAGRADVVRLNVHEPVSKPFMERLGFQFVPTFVLLDGDGNEVWRSLGTLDPKEVSRQVDSLEG